MSGAVAVGVAAVAVGTAVATDFATFAVVAAVGATVGAIGTIAKVPALQIAGAAIGVVGAVGGIASAAGAFGEAGVFGSVNSTQGFTASQALGGATGGFSESAAQIAGTSGADNLAGLGANASGADNAWAAAQSGAQVQWGGGSAIDQVNGGMTTAAAAASPNAAEPPVISQGDGEGTSLGNVRNPGAPDANVNPSILTQSAPVVNTPLSTPPPVSTPDAPVPTGGTPPGTDVTIPGYDAGVKANMGTMNMGTPSDSWGNIWGFIKDNKTLVSGAVQAIGSFASGMLNPLTPAQIAALNASAKANQAAANQSNAQASILNQRASNMQQPLPVASITGRPTLGLLQQASPVTGVPA